MRRFSNKQPSQDAQQPPPPIDQSAQQEHHHPPPSGPQQQSGSPPASTVVPHGQATSQGTLNIALVNNFPAGTTVYATVTGRAIDNNNALFLLQADGHTAYYPSSPSSTTSPLAQNTAIRLGATRSTTNLTIPHIAGGRIYFSLNTPLTFFVNPGPALVEPSVTNRSDPNINLDWGFCEFTFNSAQLYANISYVDFVSSIPVALRLTTANSGTQSVGGLVAGGLDKVCSALRAQHAADGKGWDQLVVTHNGRNLRALSPNQGMVSNSSLFASYYDAYVNQVWQRYATQNMTVDTQSSGVVSGRVASDTLHFSPASGGGSGQQPIGNTVQFTRPSTRDIFTCSTGPFALTGDALKNALIPRVSAAFNRSTLLKTASFPAAQNLFYQESVTNHYSRIVHQNNVDGRGYAFPYDDVQPSGGKDLSGEVHAGDPSVWTVTVGGT